MAITLTSDYQETKSYGGELRLTSATLNVKEKIILCEYETWNGTEWTGKKATLRMSDAASAASTVEGLKGTLMTSDKRYSDPETQALIASTIQSLDGLITGIMPDPTA